MFGLVPLEDIQQPVTTLEKFIFLFRNLNSTHRPTALVSFITLVLLIFVRTVKRRLVTTLKWMYILPEVFLAIVLSTVFCKVGRWDEKGVAILGDVRLTRNADYFQFPLTGFNFQFLQRTTSTAM